MSPRLRALIKRRDKALADARELTDVLADDEDMTEADQERCDALLAEVDSLNASIAREEKLAAQILSAPVIEDEPEPAVTGGTPRVLDDPKRGFSHFGEFATALIGASMPGNRMVDDRLRIGAAAPGTNFANEAVGEEGGYLVPPEFANSIRTYSLEDDALLPLTSSDTVSGNAIRIPVDETTPWGTDGIRAYWEGEAALSTNTKPALEQRELRLRKLFGVVPVTDELIEDSVFVASYLPRKLGQSIRYKVNDAIVNGAGSGVPQGFAQSGALITQAKESGQTADTINATNVSKMYARNISPTTGVWLVNPDAFHQLPLMTIGDQPVWTPPGNFADSPHGRLLGRPLIMSENCQTVGDAGDIYFASLNWYQTITKGRGIDFATSMHLWFDYDMTAFRATFRVDGQSIVRSAVTPPNSSITRSPFVQLAARA